MHNQKLLRCPWAARELAIAYHDEEWGVPVHNDSHLLEMLILEGAQAGLSWDTILKKRVSYREAYEGFDAGRVAEFDERKVAELLANPGIVRNRLKVAASIANARATLALRREGISLDEFLWAFVGGSPQQNMRRTMADIPAQTPESKAMSQALLARGFRFVGPTICYAFMQAVGMVNDHLVTCPRHAEITRLSARSRPARKS